MVFSEVDRAGQKKKINREYLFRRKKKKKKSKLDLTILIIKLDFDYSKLIKMKDNYILLY